MYISDLSMKCIPKCQNVIETKAVNVGPFFHIALYIFSTLNYTSHSQKKDGGFPLCMCVESITMLHEEGTTTP